jgi:protein-tyrosine phosphatase
MAEGVLRAMLRSRGADDRFELDSAGTHDYHVGSAPFLLAAETARKRGYDITQCVARRVRASDFDHFDLILAMDRMNIAAMRAIAPTRAKQKIELLMDYGDKYRGRDIPDPYGGQAKDFDLTLDMIEDGCQGLADLIARVPQQRRTSP